MPQSIRFSHKFEKNRFLDLLVNFSQNGQIVPQNLDRIPDSNQKPSLDLDGANKKKVRKIGLAVPKEIGHNHTRIHANILSLYNRDTIYQHPLYIATGCLHVCLRPISSGMAVLIFFVSSVLVRWWFLTKFISDPASGFTW